MGANEEEKATTLSFKNLPGVKQYVGTAVQFSTQGVKVSAGMTQVLSTNSCIACPATAGLTHPKGVKASAGMGVKIKNGMGVKQWSGIYSKPVGFFIMTIELGMYSIFSAMMCTFDLSTLVRWKLHLHNHAFH